MTAVVIFRAKHDLLGGKKQEVWKTKDTLLSNKGITNKLSKTLHKNLVETGGWVWVLVRGLDLVY